MARLQTFARDIQLATAGISPQNISAELAKFSRQELANVIQSGEGSPQYDIYVNGNFGASETSVVAPGPILYIFSWWDDIATFALQYLIDRSPESSGRYKNSWFIMVGGQVIADPKKIPPTSSVILTNDQPYHRKIDVGHMKMSVPPGVVEDARKAVMSIWGNLITAKRTLIQLPGGYVLKGHFTKGIRPHARTKLRPDTQAGAPMTYPALLLEMRV
jgi:hypothetical protein